jgi:hypothetical protein
LEVVFSNKHIIASLIYSDPLDSPWMLLSIRGSPEHKFRKKFWVLMKDLISSFSGPWLIIGDLNSLCSNIDKKGGRLGGNSDSNWLNDFVANSGAIDLGFYGPQFTWSNKREGLANIKERLDRGLCDPEWQRIFPKAGVRHLGALTSDHKPILLDTHIDNCKLNRPFLFEAMWTKDESSVEVIERTWDINVEGSQSFKLAKKIKRLQMN